MYSALFLGLAGEPERKVIAKLLYKCTQFLLPDLFGEKLPANITEEDSYIKGSCPVENKPQQVEDNGADEAPGFICTAFGDDEDEDCPPVGSNEGVKFRDSNPNNKYMDVPKKQLADTALRRRFVPDPENSNNMPNINERTQSDEIAENEFQKDDQDEVVDVRKPPREAVQMKPNIAGAPERPQLGAPENPNNRPNIEHIQPVGNADNMLQENNQDEVADGPRRAQGNRVPHAPEVPMDEPNAREQIPVENDANNIQPGGVQEVDEGPQAQRPPAPIARQITRVQVSHDTCKHLLKDATYNEMDDLSDALDDGIILDVMKTLISTEEFEHIWSSCHGGSDPPMNLLFHLAGQNYKLSDLKRFAKYDNGCRFGDLISLLDTHDRSDRHCMEKRLDELDFRLLSNIAELLRAKPYPQRRPLWKRLASCAGLDEATIAVLDVPATGERKSITMAFLKRISHTNPQETVAWLASGLVANGLRHILVDDDIKIFKKCRDQCIDIA